MKMTTKEAPYHKNNYVGSHKSIYDSKYSTMTVNIYWMEGWKEP